MSSTIYSDFKAFSIDMDSPVNEADMFSETEALIVFAKSCCSRTFPQDHQWSLFFIGSASELVSQVIPHMLACISSGLVKGVSAKSFKDTMASIVGLSSKVTVADIQAFGYEQVSYSMKDFAHIADRADCTDITVYRETRHQLIMTCYENVKSLVANALSIRQATCGNWYAGLPWKA